MSWLNATCSPGEAPVVSLVQTHLQEISPSSEQNACPEPILNHYNEINVNPAVENSSRSTQRKLKSKVWEEFKKFEGKDGKVWAKCIHCKKKFDGSSKKGTTHLNNHLKRCRSNEETGDGCHATVNLTNLGKFVINQDLNQLDVVRAIIKYGFFKMNIIKPDILLVYKEEKEKLSNYLTKLSCRFSLAIRWFDESLLMILHFIDDNWELKQKTISFHHAIDGDFSSTLQGVISDWNIKNNICSVVTNVDNNDVMISSWVTGKRSLPGGPLLSAGCLAGFLKSYKCDEMNWVIGKIRKSLDYVHKPSNKHKFQLAIESAESMGRKVNSESVPSWCTLGLDGFEIALGFKEAFLELESMYSDFKSVNLTTEEWDKATAMYEFLKMLNDAAQSLSDTKYTTANVFFPKVCELYVNLLFWQNKCMIHESASRAKEMFFDKYWRKYKLVLAIAIVLDPRFKLDIVERWYREIYGDYADGNLKEVVDFLTNVYNEYAKGHSEMLDQMGRPCTLSQNSQLLVYLKEPKITPVEEFNILAWWHLNSSKFPIVARMAREILAIPISPTAIADSILETEIDFIINGYGLDVDIKSALVCTKFWLESSKN